MIAIDGRLETQAWTDRDGNNRVTVGIVAESVRQQAGGQQAQRQGRQRQGP